MRDIKNYTIGFLSAICLFLFYGYTDQKVASFDKLRVKELIVDNYVDLKGSMFIYNTEEDDHLMHIGTNYISMSRIKDVNKSWFEKDNLESRLFIGKSTKQDGFIELYDRYGDAGYQITGNGQRWIRK